MIDYNKALEAIEKTVTSSSLYWQSMGLIVCFIASYLFYRVTKQLFFSKIVALSLRKNIQLNRFITRYLIPLYYPLTTLIFLAFGLSVYEKFFQEAILFITTLKLILLFLFFTFHKFFLFNIFF